MTLTTFIAQRCGDGAVTARQAVTARRFTRRGIGLAVGKRREHWQPLIGAMTGFADLTGDWMITGFTAGDTAMATGTNILRLGVVNRL